MKKIFLGFIFLTLPLLFSGCFRDQSAGSNIKTGANGEVQMDNFLSRAEQLQVEAKNPKSKAPTPENKTEPQKEEVPANENQALDFLKKYDQAVLHTNKGEIKVKFYNNDAPKTVNNFLKLASENFYNETKFHRVIKDFMIQGGDPNSKDDNWDDDGKGGPDYKFEDEINSHKLVKGSLAMANSGPDTNGSQFFIVTAKATAHLDGKHTCFGKVTEGMKVVEAIEKEKTNSKDHPLEDIVIKKIDLIEKNK